MTKAKAPTKKESPISAEINASSALSVKNAANEYVTALYGENAREIIRTMPKSQQQQTICELMMAGVSMTQCADFAGVSRAAIGQWFSREPVEMQKLMRQALTRDALIEMPKTWTTLKDTRDSVNEETRRKGALDCARAAGLHMDPGTGATGAISIHAQNLQFNNLSVADLDRKILELAAKLGPDAIQLAEAEVKGVGKPTVNPEGGASPEPGLSPA